MFYGLGADGTVGANKNSIKIIGENTDNYAQGFFVYDSKKSGAITVSHLRFGPRPIRSSYLVSKANFVACHQWIFLERYDMLSALVPGGVFLLNSPFSKDEVWEHLPRAVQEQLIAKKAKVYVIDAYQVARDTGMGSRMNTIMQTCFFAISKVLPRDEAIEAIRQSIRDTYGKKGEEIVQKNLQAVDETVAHLFEVTIPESATSKIAMPAPFSVEAPQFERDVLGVMYAGHGDDLPVSAFPADGTFPTGTAKWEKRDIALEIPVWDTKTCIQCGKCAMVCPHAVIRIKVYDSRELAGAPATFKATEARDKEWQSMKYTIQVAPEDCTGCGICVDICPAKNKSETRLKAINMMPQPPLRAPESENWDFFLKIPEFDRRHIKTGTIRQQQVQEPLFEFSGACSGCGETPYLKLVSQLFGDRAVIANATGCSSIYGGNLPTTPWSKNADGRGPAWSNSLFEDNAEFGMGFRVSIDKQTEFARELVKRLAPAIGEDFAEILLSAPQADEADIYSQRERVALLKKELQKMDSPEAKQLLAVADMLVKKSVWIVGGDGWAYDIGYGGLDHVLASGRNVNLLVLDTEVYSNTGGQASKSTPRGRRSQICRRWKTICEKGPRPDGHELRQCLCGQRRHGSQGRAHSQSVPGGGGLQRPQPDHRLLTLHRPRHQHDHRNVRSESCRGLRTVAALSLQPRARSQRRKSACPRFPHSYAQGAGLPAAADSFQNAHQEQAGTCQAAVAASSERRGLPLPPL